MDKHQAINWLCWRLAKDYRDNPDLQATVDHHDVARALTDGAFMARFVRPRLSLPQAFDALVDCLRWRQSFGIPRFTEEGMAERSIDASLFYFHGRDKDSRPLGICKLGALCLNKTMSVEEKQQLLVYRFERMSIALPAEEQITIILDVSDVRDGDVPIEMLLFFGRALVKYYPKVVGVVLVLCDPEHPLRVFSILSTILQPAECWRIKQVSVSDLFIDVPQTELPFRLGGTNDFSPAFATEEHPCRAWASADRAAVLETCTERLQSSDVEAFSSGTFASPRHPPVELSGSLASVWPSQELEFEGLPTSDSTTSIIITNTSAFDIAFKFKTSNPQQFKIRPPAGFVPVCDSVEVIISKRASKDAKTKEKCLAQFARLPPGHNAAQSDWLTEHWKSVSATQLQEVRLNVTHARPPIYQPPTEDPMTVLNRIENRIQELIATMPPTPPPRDTSPRPSFLYLALLLLGYLLGLLSPHLTSLLASIVSGDQSDTNGACKASLEPRQ